MAVQNLNGMSTQDVIHAVQNGGKFVTFYYTISIIFMTFKRGSDTFFLRPGESAFKFGWKYLVISMLLGWWGFPWGPIYTLQSIFTAFAGNDVTAEMMAQVRR